VRRRESERIACIPQGRRKCVRPQVAARGDRAGITATPNRPTIASPVATDAEMAAAISSDSIAFATDAS
jgi:hypothetical protein